MREEVFYELYNYGFTEDEIQQIEDNNNFIFDAQYDDIKKILEFLKYKGLEKEDIIKLINNNPFMLTESTKRLRYYENIYNNILNFSKEELIYILKNNPECYTSSPIEFEKIIDILKKKNLSIDNVKKLVLNNPKVINIKSSDILEYLNMGD